jgi:SAM-dependent methyltransferase
MHDLKPIEIEVRESDPLPLMRRVEQAYVDRFGADPEDKGGWYEPDGWKRISRVFERVQLGGDVLDVGSGAGQFVNCLALSGCFRSVTTTDTTRFKKYVELSEDINRVDWSVAELRFEDDSFDVVTCMEVLEHVPQDVLHLGIAELRRVCRGQLIITVPYREPEPISKTHVRRFEDEDLLTLFPDAHFSILRRPQKPWAFVEEYPKGNHPPVIGSLLHQLKTSRAQVEALVQENVELRSRKSIRAANWVGSRARSIIGR